MGEPLFKSLPQPELPETILGSGTAILNGYALALEQKLISAIHRITTQAPLRHMTTPGGFQMSVANTNCGVLGWVSDRRGYRYDSIDPDSGLPWPKMPEVFSRLATTAAAEAGFRSFEPDACLINRYQPGTRLSLHQDKDEHDFDQPIVSVSLGLPVIFLFGGMKRSDPAVRIPLLHGDVVVWGGPARLRYHGVNPLKDGTHPLLGGYRYNLTFRKAG